jgi:hypothetical protein
MPRSVQQNERGIDSKRSSGLDVTTTGAGCIVAAGRTSNGCVFVMLTEGPVPAGRGRMRMRAVSFFGPG